MKNTTREESTTTKPLGMKWYKFLIYFALFAGAFVNFIYGINYISGGIYVVETNGLITADTIYKLYGVGLQVVDILYGLFLLALAVFGLVLRNQLAKYKPDAPHFVRIFYSISAGAPFLYSIIVALITLQSLGIEAMLSLIVGLIFTLWNVEYFKKRAHLFTDNPTITQEDAPAPSQMQNDVPVTPSATVTEESPKESNVAVENTPVEDSKTIEPEKIAEISLSPKGEIPKKYGNYNISGSEVRFNPEDSPSAIPEQTTVSSESVPPRPSRYCSRCGGEVDADTAKCTKCGKQYLNKLTKIGIAIIAAAVLIIIVIICIAAGTKDGNANNNTTNSNNGSNTSMSVAEQTIAMRIAEMVSGKDSEYYDYIQEAYTIARTGNETYGKGKGAVVNYINHLPIEYGESIIMFRLIYQSDSTYCREIVEYLNGRNDISYDDTVYILTNLGFMVSSNGTVSWD